MEPFGRLFLTVVSLLILGVLSISAQEEDSESALFTLVQAEPVIRHSPKSSDWDGRFTDPGAVTFHEGKFHMIRNGFQTWPGVVQMGYLTSDDGITWHEESTQPVLTTAEIPYAGLAALASSLMVTEDGTWVLYFYTWENNTFKARNFIGRATAETPLGPWTVDPDPVLSPGEAGGWDDLGLVGPRVVKTDDGYAMYYGAANTRDRAFSGIGMAKSVDGIVWEKYNDAMTTDDAFADSDPVLQGIEGETFVHQPMVHQTADGWVMLYRTAPYGGGDSRMSILYATSVDGMAWQTAAAPVWLPDTLSRISGFWWTASAYYDETFYLYIEGGSMGSTNIYIGMFSGKLP